MLRGRTFPPNDQQRRPISQYYAAPRTGAKRSAATSRTKASAAVSTARTWPPSSSIPPAAEQAMRWHRAPWASSASTCPAPDAGARRFPCLRRAEPERVLCESWLARCTRSQRPSARGAPRVGEGRIPAWICSRVVNERSQRSERMVFSRLTRSLWGRAFPPAIRRKARTVRRSGGTRCGTWCARSARRSCRADEPRGQLS